MYLKVQTMFSQKYEHFSGFHLKKAPFNLSDFNKKLKNFDVYRRFCITTNPDDNIKNCAMQSE